MPLIPTFRLPTQIHTRGANAKWLSELAHNKPVWIHPRDAKRFGVGDGQRIRVETELGHFVAEAGDVPGQIRVELKKSNAVYRDWLAMTRAPDPVSPDGSRRPRWMIRPLKPTPEASRLPSDAKTSP